MAHMNSYDSMKSKRSLAIKKRAKEKSLDKKNNEEFIIKKADNYGVIIEVRYDDAYVLFNGEIILCKLRRDINMVCNQVLFPGDKVIIDNNKIIQNMISRKTMLSRTKKDSTRLDDSIGLTKNVAANIDLAVIVVSAQEPPLHPKFIDRYLMILQNSNIDTVICLNKSDLKTDEDEKIIDVYRQIGIPVVETSTLPRDGIEELKSYLYGKQAIFVGNSGVGKSSLTNAIMEGNEIKTGHVGEKSKRGRHTTTTSKYYVWEHNSSIIDTPGIRSLDVSSFDAIDIQDYFIEFNNWKVKCKYGDCLHDSEPIESCMVKQAVEGGFINKNRYDSYIRILRSITKEVDNDEKINATERK